MKSSVKRKGPPLTLAVLSIDRWLSKTSSVLAIVGITALVAAILVVVGDILWRRIGGQSFIGAVDLTQFSVVIAASLAIPYAFSRQSHVRVDLLSGVLSTSVTRLLDVLALALCVGILCFLFLLSWGRMMEIWTYGDVSQDLAIPMVYFWSALLVGLGLSVAICSIKAIKLALTGDFSDDN